MFHQLLTTVHEFYKPPTKCHQCGINVSNQWQTIHVFDNTVTKFSRHCLTNTLSLRVPHHITSKTFLRAEVFFERKRWHLTGYKDCCTNNSCYIWSHQCCSETTQKMRISKNLGYFMFVVMFWNSGWINHSTPQVVWRAGTMKQGKRNTSGGAGAFHSLAPWQSTRFQEMADFGAA